MIRIRDFQRHSPSKNSNLLPVLVVRMSSEHNTSDDTGVRNERNTSKFKGHVAGMKGHIYDCGPHRQAAEQYIKTTEYLAYYFVMNYTNAGNFHNAILKLTFPVVPPLDIPEVAEDGSPLNEIESFKYIETFKRQNEEVQHMEQLNMTLYSVVWSQCSHVMRGRLTCMKNFKTIDSQSDGIALLKAIRLISFGYNESVYSVKSINDALTSLLLCRQTKHMSVREYFHQFQIRREVYEEIGGSPAASPGTLAVVADKAGLTVEALTDEHHTSARELELATLFIQNADQNRYSEIQISLHNNFLFGNDNNPMNLMDAYRLLVNWKSSSSY